VITDEVPKLKKNPGFFSVGKTALRECRMTFKEGGLKAVIRRYGWKIFVAFFAYYLIRDLTIYVFIPYLVAKHFLS
jgi:hypothetical protein